MSNKTQLAANILVNAPIDEVRTWFLSLNEHPGRYRFESHEGFVITQGKFGEVGSKFYTTERFFRITLQLRFIITSVEDYTFSFDCRPPMKGAWCKFVLQEQTPEQTSLSLIVGTRSRLHARILEMDFLRDAIQYQIDAEVKNIKASVETILTKGVL